jgi:hypothetical protein
MKKEKRIPMHITLSTEFSKIFDDFCLEKGINKSRLIEWVLIKYFENDEKS